MLLFSSCHKQEAAPSGDAPASRCGGFSRCGARASLGVEHGLCGTRASAAVVSGLQSPGSIAVVLGLSCLAGCGVFLDQGLNLRLLHWQADSLPLGHLWEAPTLGLDLVLSLGLHSPAGPP